LDALAAAWTAGLPAAEVMHRLQENGVPAGVVQDAADLAGDPQLKDRGFFIEKPWPGHAFADASPVRLSGSTAACIRPAPGSGRDNEEIYGRLLGMGPEDLAALRQDGVI
jgi:crotonobetainyl-CoA:carnitine CoA-transferase CaiB-like acyl-CoA transferase